MFDFADALEYLDGFVDYERKPPEALAPRDFGLDRVRDLLGALGAPHEKLRCFHIAGTKGKGSTAAMTASVLRAAGYRTGLYTSPHLVDVRERITVDGEMIPPGEFARLLDRTRPYLDGIMREAEGRPPGEVRRPTYFEIMTHLAFLHFVESKVDAAVLEVGLGGRFDATNVIERPVACAVTSIGYDHTEMLGGTLAEIAREKAGILKAGSPAVVAPQRPGAAEAIDEAAAKVGVPLWRVGREIALGEERDRGDEGDRRFDVRTPGRSYEGLTLPLWGAHQRENAAVAVGLAELARRAGFERVTPAAVREGLACVSWPGRIQKVAERPVTILDGAHNAESIRALTRTLAERFPGSKPVYVFAALGDKPWEEMLGELSGSATALVATTAMYGRSTTVRPLHGLPAHPSMPALNGLAGRSRRRSKVLLERHPRAVGHTELAAAARRAGIANVESEADPAMAFMDARDLAGEEGMAVATGSLYLVGSLLALFPPARP